MTAHSPSRNSPTRSRSPSPEPREAHRGADDALRRTEGFAAQDALRDPERQPGYDEQAAARGFGPAAPPPGRAPRYFFHGTQLAYLHGIARGGLIPAKKPGLTAAAAGGREPTPLDGACNFLYPHAEGSRDVADRLKTVGVLLRIDVNSLDPARIDQAAHELRYRGEIPAAAIEVETTAGEWERLTAIEFTERDIGLPVPLVSVPEHVAATEATTTEAPRGAGQSTSAMTASSSS